MKVDKVVVGDLETNCYIISADNHVLVIDPGDEYDKIQDIIKDKSVDGVLVTHSHFDHVGALYNFDENIVYDFYNLEEGNHKIGGFEFEVLTTPGHKSDSISFYFKDIDSMFVGDFIFKGSVGRTDLETGNIDEMFDSLRKTSKYSDKTIIYPGHGMQTTFAEERKNNMYFTFI